jgi:Cu+-exporting ATPase
VAADPFMRWVMPSLTPVHEPAAPWLPAFPARAISFALLFLTLGAMGWAGRHFYTRAWMAFRHHSADMNTLIAVGTGAAFAYSVVATVAPGFFIAHGVAPDVYYEAVTIIIALILTGNAFEARAKRRTHAALRALANLQPATARVMRDGAEVTCRWSGWRAATRWWCAPGSACRWTARWCAAAARWTSRCSPASRSPWRSGRGTG